MEQTQWITHFETACHPFLLEVVGGANIDIFLVKGRQTKWGDFRYSTALPRPIITVNNDLNPWSKFLTFLHEFAHYQTHVTFGHRIKPHGKEWQETFRKLLIQLLETGILPSELEMVIGRHMAKPRATLAGDPELRRALKKFDEKPAPYLEDLVEGSHFTVRGRSFVKGAKRRTRYLCVDQKTGKKFLVHGLTEVDLVQLDS